MLKNTIFLLGGIILSTFVSTTAQPIHTKQNPGNENEYRETPEKINDLVHTILYASFNFDQSQMSGLAKITLKPHFYPTDSLKLDAKGMEINKISIVKAGKTLPVQYQYDGNIIRMHLDKTYTSKESYTVEIGYTAKPDEVKAKGSAAITDAKGLYFINPRGTDKNKPTQIWTQGETEATSVWIPTIDRPNQKSTQEFNLTVPAKYVTLSNGKLTKQTVNKDGTRTDQWIMNLPHSPYLFFMAVGEFAIIKDSYKGKEVNYYVEKEYAKVASRIFGNTPEMMQYFSKILGIEYPWIKYSQIVVRDYVSGAMENTTATLHQETAQQDARQLTDGNEWESTVAHELFHQWFGDYVTAESWSNLTVNESFANYSELLWSEYKYGKDAAAYDNAKDMEAYLDSRASANKDLVRFTYRDQEDMFDLVSYNKGGRILHMLRNLVGDEAFFTSLHQYLSDNRFSNGSAHKLRMAFESVTGKDLNWFFNQWYFNHGHPKLDISYGYDADLKKAQLIIHQTQEGNLFKLPVKVDVYESSAKKSYWVWAERAVDTFYFDAHQQPELINVDPEKILLAEKNDHKSLEQLIYQFRHGNTFGDRMEAVDFAGDHTDNVEALALLNDALNDPFFRIRKKALSYLAEAPLNALTLKKIVALAKNDPSKPVMAEAINVLSKKADSSYHDLFLNAVKDSSYSVSGEALEALSLIDNELAYTLAKKLSKEPAKGKLSNAIASIIAAAGDENGFDLITAKFTKLPMSTEKFTTLITLSECLQQLNNNEKFKQGIDLITQFRDNVPAEIKAQSDQYINSLILKTLAAKKEAKGEQELADYIKSKLPK